LAKQVEVDKLMLAVVGCFILEKGRPHKLRRPHWLPIRFRDLAWNLNALTLRQRENGLPDWFWGKITETFNVFQTNCMLELGRILNDEEPMSTSLLREKPRMEKKQAEGLL